MCLGILVYSILKVVTVSGLSGLDPAFPAPPDFALKQRAKFELESIPADFMPEEPKSEIVCTHTAVYTKLVEGLDKP